MILKGVRVTLKPLSREFFKDYHYMFSPVVRQALGLDPVCTQLETEKFLEGIIRDGKHEMCYCIFDNQTNKLIGSIAVRAVDHPNGQLGAWVNENFWGAGRYQEALILVLKKYFKSNDSIFAFVKVKNERSLKAHKKAGFDVADKFMRNGYDYYKIILDKGSFEKNRDERT